jgi:serine/threonine-protein kinase
LYKALSNRVPHPKREGLGQLIVAICTEPVPPIQGFAPWVPAEIAAILDRAFQLDIERRYQNATEFRETIEAVLGSSSTLTQAEIRMLTDDERAVVARRHTSVFPPPVIPDPPLRRRRGSGPEESRTQPGIVQIAAIPTTSPRRTRWAFAGVIGVVAVAAALVYVRMFRHPPPMPSQEPVPSVVASAESSDAKKARSVRVEVEPVEATVEVDGKPVAVNEGGVVVEGELGSTHRVKLAMDGRETSAEVAITQTGAMPPKLILERAAVGPTRRPIARGAEPKKAPTVEPPKPVTKEPTKAAAPKGGVGVVNDFE